MKEIERIAEQLKLLFEGPSWLGPPIYTLLSDVSRDTASRRIHPNVHTGWELVLHMTAWLRIARERLSATSPIDPSEAENWPAPTGSLEDALASLRAETTALIRSLQSFPPERLDELAPATEPQTFYVLLHGVMQHSAYHAGQIAVMKKALRTESFPH
jgi:uncharacterized damage-inducible protein DinB